MDYVFAKIGSRIGDSRATPSVIHFFVTITVESDVYLALGDQSSVGCGPELPRIAYSQNGTSNKLYSSPKSTRYLREAHPAYVRFAFEDTSSV